MTIADEANYNFKDGNYKVFDDNGNLIYLEDDEGYWEMWDYDERGNDTYYRNSHGYWEKFRYDKQGNIIYYKSSNEIFETKIRIIK